MRCPIDVIGLNCSTGPSQMRDAVRYLAENSRCFVSVIPNAGLPLMGPKGETIYPETPDELAKELSDFVNEFGVNIVGGCCGSTPEHITALRNAVDAKAAAAARVRAASINKQSERSDPVPQVVASAMTAVALQQEPRPLLVGERINSQGSRKIKRLAARG